MQLDAHLMIRTSHFQLELRMCLAFKYVRAVLSTFELYNCPPHVTPVRNQYVTIRKASNSTIIDWLDGLVVRIIGLQASSVRGSLVLLVANSILELHHHDIDGIQCKEQNGVSFWPPKLFGRSAETLESDALACLVINDAARREAARRG